MHSRLEKPIIREERAETSLVAFIEFGFPISRSNNWQTQERVFEEKGLIFYLRLKEEVWESIRTIPEPLKMTKKRTFLVWRPISKAIFQKLKPASKNPRAGNRRWIFPETESVLTWKIGERQPLFLAVLKFVVEVPFQKWISWDTGGSSPRLEKKPTINSWTRHAFCDSVLSYGRNRWKFEHVIRNSMGNEIWSIYNDKYFEIWIFYT